MKILYVHGDDDYAALTFSQEYGGWRVSDIISKLENPKLDGQLIRAKYEEMGIELEVLEVGEVSHEFRGFLVRRYLDEDQTKHHFYYFEDETID